MSYCLNPICAKPENIDDHKICPSCGSSLLLKDRYRTIKPIGQGGFGKTFLAIDEDMPSKPYCVIKQFFCQGSRDIQKAKELFRQEAVQLETLGKQHPQIPSLLAHFELGSGLYLIQEFIDGQDLIQELNTEGAFNESKIWQLLNDLLPVLQFIHSQRVIHRDIKPENIIRRKSDGKLFLVDFGVSKFATETNLGRTGTVIGSPGYAAPEQNRGKAFFSSDLYGLGTTCFHLLTHTHPYDVFKPYTSWEKYLKIHLSKIEIGDTLRNLLTKLLEPDINQRYQKAEEVIEELEIETNLTSKEVIEELEIETNSISYEPVLVSPLVFPNSFYDFRWICTKTLTGHTWDVMSVAISPDNQLIASAGTDHTIKIWNLQRGENISTALNYVSDKRPADIYSIAFSPNGKMLVSGGWGSNHNTQGQRTIKLWDLSNMSLLTDFFESNKTIYSVTFSPDGQTLVSAGADSIIRLWNIQARELINRLESHTKAVNSIIFSSNGKIIASASDDTTIKIWNLKTGGVFYTMNGHYDRVNSVAFSPNGNILASGSRDATIKIWDTVQGKLINTIIEQNSIKTVAFSPDQEILASGSTDATIKIWDVITGKLINTLTGHSAAVNSLVFSSDRKILVSGSSDSTIKIWQLEGC
ncbi:MAG TPA: serine/threonine-protein kinase [Nostocaceae cyanobacterium]|nr:serine/threonine-protein kinase [Nostocaceae cyanobacterium]